MTAVVNNPCPPSLVCSSRGWTSLLVSHHGRKNREREFPNQDAGHGLTIKDRRWLIASIGDGHGGDLHPRSSTGSRFAVHASNSEWTELINQRPELRAPSIELAQAANSFPSYLTHRWRDAIVAFHQSWPWRGDELTTLSSEDRQELFDDPCVGYGTTLLSAAVHRTAILAAQLGDGAVLAVDDQGTPEYLIRPIEQAIANATDSLCHHNAQYRLQTQYLPVARNCPDMLLLTTDGYVNAFADSQGLLKAAHDFWHLSRRRGRRYLAKHLPRWIAEATEATSFDDATVLLLFRDRSWMEGLL